ncbi:MAG: DUF2079 domain-containing protein [Candidatus Eisenbacteria bacterium]|uniref:DUF2079 domain-containing protein n=1 Tax=Eiseniibacteriota bacterium TaxID=2212470 RepID=A0A849SDV3_UNCEI|nr:DUF2079 domain-containing protein [Candidatus Eisenbacteria bacterium]
MKGRRPASAAGSKPKPRLKSIAPPPATPAGWFERLTLALLITAYLGVYGTAVWVKHRYFLYTDFDLAIFTQAIDRLAHGSFWNSVRGMNWLGDHSSLILIPLAPLLAPFKNPLALLWAQTLVLALGAIPAYRLTRRLTGDPVAALSVALLYLMFPAVGYVNLFEFHPEAFATAPLLAAIDDLSDGRWRRGLLFAALAMLAREDVALAALGLAAFVLWLRRPGARATAARLAGLATVSLALTFLILQPMFSRGEAEYARMFGAWGQTPGTVLANLATHPWRAIEALFSTPGDPGDGLLKREYWLHLLLPVGALPLAAPLLLLAALPLLLLHLLSSRPQQHAIAFQYTAAVTPFVIAAAAFGLARLGRAFGAARSRLATRVLVVVALAASGFANYQFGPLFGHSRWQHRPPTERSRPDDAARRLRPFRERLVARIPPDAATIASFEYLPHLSARAELHSMHHILSGVYTFSSRSYPVPERIDAMIGNQGMEFRNAASRERLLGLIARNHLRPADGFDDAVLLLRGARDTVSLIDVAPRMPQRVLAIRFDDEIELVGVDPVSAVVQPGEVVTLITYWARRAPVTQLFATNTFVLDSTAQPRQFRARYLGYGLFTAERWRQDVVMRDTYRLVVSGTLPDGKYRVAFRVAHRRFGNDDREGGLAHASIAALNEPDQSLQMGSFEVRRAR